MKNKYSHLLECQHCIGTHCRTYYMRCNILGQTKNSIKLEVIGERDWKYYENKKRIRYLPKNESWRLQEKLNENNKR